MSRPTKIKEVNPVASRVVSIVAAVLIFAAYGLLRFIVDIGSLT